jgi:hypothetical protein
VLPLSTRAFGRVPLTGEVDKPRQKERAPVAPEDDTNEQFADQQSRCEIDKILTQEGKCRRLGEVQLEERPLCVRHAKLLRLKNRCETKLGIVFEMDQWLESVEGQADELRVRRVEHQRNEVVEQLRFDRTQIALIRHGLLKDNDGATPLYVK